VTPTGIEEQISTPTIPRENGSNVEESATVPSQNPAPAEGSVDPEGSVARAKAEEAAPDAEIRRALDRASAAGRWDVVSQLAEELRARRLDQAGNVVRFDRDARKGTR